MKLFLAFFWQILKLIAIVFSLYWCTDMGGWWWIVAALLVIAFFDKINDIDRLLK